MSAIRTGRVGRPPAKPGTRFGISCRNGLVHRIKNGTDLYAAWLCGGAANIVTLVKDPAEFGSVCKRCEVMFAGPVVYHCYSAVDWLLYIGSCVFWPSREDLHRRNTHWWSEVARVDTVHHSDLPAARRAEKAAIRAEAPLYNKQHNVKRFRLVGHVYVPIAEAA